MLLQDGQGERGEELTKESQLSLSSKQLHIIHSFTRMKWLVNKQGGWISDKDRGSHSDQQPSSGRSYKPIFVSLQWDRGLNFIGLNTFKHTWKYPWDNEYTKFWCLNAHTEQLCHPWGCQWWGKRVLGTVLGTGECMAFFGQSHSLITLFWSVFW